MNLILQLSPEVESRLRAQAKTEGRSIESLALHALEQQLSVDQTTPAPLTREQWHTVLEETLARIPRTTAVVVDDSRESIYEGRGE